MEHGLHNGQELGTDLPQLPNASIATLASVTGCRLTVPDRIGGIDVTMSVPGPADVEPLCAYERERAARILRNRQVMGERGIWLLHSVLHVRPRNGPGKVMMWEFGRAEDMGLLQQATLFQAGLKSVRAPRPEKKAQQVQHRNSASCWRQCRLHARCCQPCHNLHSTLSEGWYVLQPSSPCKRRASTRLANLPPENRGLTGDEREHHGAHLPPAQGFAGPYVPVNIIIRLMHGTLPRAPGCGGGRRRGRQA